MRSTERHLLFITLALLTAIITGCGGGGGNDNPSPTDITLSPVTALYPSNGDNWNDYVSSSLGTASDTACDAATDTACVHGGEKRVVTVNGRSSCSGVTASDALDAFNWTCDASTGTARIVSTGLKDGMNLSDLLDFSAPGWKTNTLSVNVGGAVHSTASSTAWWSNPVVVDNDGGSISTAGTVYLVTTSMTGTYTFGASKVALVSKPGTTITGPGAGANSYVISTSSRDFLWFEGTVDATGDEVGLRPFYVRFSVIKNTTIENASQCAYLLGVSNSKLSRIKCNNNLYGLALWSGTNNNTFSWITASNNGDRGLHFYQASNNTLSGVTASNNGRNGIDVISSSNNNTLSGVTASNNTENGVNISYSDSNTFSDVVTSNNGNTGVSIGGAINTTLANITTFNNYYGLYLHSNSFNNTLTGVTSSNNDYYGIRLNLTWNNMLSGITTLNNGLVGVYLSSAATTSNTLSDVTASNNGNIGVSLADSSYNSFTGLLKVGNNGGLDCQVTGGTNPGLVHATCANQGSSDAGLSTSVTLAASFFGKVTTDDTANNSDSSGSAAYPADPAAFDWSNFENSFRSWGKDGTFADSSSQGHFGCFPATYDNQTDCESSGGIWSGSGRIWDWSLLASDAVIKNVLQLPTGTDTLTHTWSDLSSITFLRHAVEISGDGIGNENTLCESGETCLYTPNIGSYQGHGPLVNTGTFFNGTLTGITLLKYEMNGY